MTTQVHCHFDDMMLVGHVKPNNRNPNFHPPEQLRLYGEIIEAQGWRRSLVISKRSGLLTRGHGALETAKLMNWPKVPVEYQEYDSEEQEIADMIADNRLASLAEMQNAALSGLLEQLKAAEFPLEIAGYTEDAFKALLDSLKVEDPKFRSLADRFGIPPFTVLDSRGGLWQTRKAAWMSLGIRSEIGRGANLMSISDTAKQYTKSHEDAIAGVKVRADARKLVPGGTGRNSVWRGKGKDGKGMSVKEAGQASAKDIRDNMAFRMQPGAYSKESASLKGGLTCGTSTDPYRKPGEENEGPEFSGTSVFDPVLCELAYRWFCPSGGRVLDPFAGGSVRGVVAGLLGYNYVGIDLREEQVNANRAQWVDISSRSDNQPKASNEVKIIDADKLTPIEKRGEYYFKRDDLFEFAGANGGKVRTLFNILTSFGQPTVSGVVSCGDRISTQIPRVARVAHALGIPCRLHTASGAFTPGMREAKELGAEIIQHDPGYLSVVRARALEDAEKQKFYHIPWGLCMKQAVEYTLEQAMMMDVGVKRIVVPVGSGMTLAGVLHGLIAFGHTRLLPVLGVQLGGDPSARLDDYAPKDWREIVKMVGAKQEFHDEAPVQDQIFEGVRLDPVYEAKCVPFMQPGDLLWIVGNRGEQAKPSPLPFKFKPVAPNWITGDSATDIPELDLEPVDLVFSCPPYADLEVYSDDPKDLSFLASRGGYPEFKKVYRHIIEAACAKLAENRFAVFVVGEVRDKDGFYLNFVRDTIDAFEAAGCKFYNNCILVTSLGSLPIRVGKQFTNTRKLGATHQHVLCFFKGDPQTVKAWAQPEFGLPEEIHST